MGATAWLEQVRAVAFDLDNTLWEVEPVIARAEARLQDWLAEHSPRIAAAVSVDAMRAAREALAQAEPHNAHDFTYLRIATLERLAREHGYDPGIAVHAFEVFFAARNEVDPFAEVHAALARLRERYALATLSNGNADLGRIGMDHLFQVTLNARQIGVGKPHPRCFERLAAELDLPPGAILYVGDDPWLDVHAARTSGLKTAWMNRREHVWPETIAGADLVVRDCAELAARLGA